MTASERPAVKICGLTRLEDARFASGAMADFLGFIAWPGSPRFVEATKVRDILAWIEGPKSVAVFVDQPLDDVNHYALMAGVHLVQLHGSESPDYIRLLDKPAIKAFSIRPDTTLADVRAMTAPYEGVAEYFLFDTWKPGQPGGTGEAFAWELLSGFRTETPWFVSGGLHAGNVEALLQFVHPYGIDLSSRLESAPGVKDLTKIADLFETLDVLYP